MALGPKIMLKQEKVKEIMILLGTVAEYLNFFSEFSRFGITHVQVKIGAIFLQIVKALSID